MPTLVEVTVPEWMSDELKEKYIKDLQTSPIRPLTSEERAIYSDAISRALIFVPAFRDAVSIMRPFMDATASTAYTDRFARVGLSYWFFHNLDQPQRASVLLHECMHVLNNHFQRAEAYPKLSPQTLNVAEDFEINTVLNRVEFVDLRSGQLPDRRPNNYPAMKTMEFYAETFMKEIKEQEDNCPVHGKNKKAQDQGGQGSQGQGQDGQGQGDQDGSQGQGQNGSQSQGQGQEGSEGQGQGGQGGQDSQSQGQGGQGQGGQGGQGSQGQGQDGQNGHGHGKGPTCSCPPKDHSHGHGQGQGEPWGCDENTEERSAKADEAGISKASDVEQTIAKANTAARIVDEKNKGGRGDGHNNEFWDAILTHLLPKKVNWRHIFRSILASTTEAVVRGRNDYTYRRSARRLTGGEFVFPGMVTYRPKVAEAIDTSGSMGNEDFQALLNEIDGIVKEVAKGSKNLSVFSVDTEAGNITPVTSASKIRLSGGGGTRMAVAWEYVKSLPKKEQPDVLVLATDGFIDWPEVEAQVRDSKFKSIILVTQKRGFAEAPQSLRKLIPVIDISKD